MEGVKDYYLIQHNKCHTRIRCGIEASLLARQYEVQGELLSPRSSASPFSSHCVKVLYASFSKVHSNHPSKSVYIWNIVTLEGCLSFHDVQPWGLCPQGGARDQNSRTPLKSDFLLCKQFMEIVGQTLVNLMTLTMS